jgi:hypothetical protein
MFSFPIQILPADVAAETAALNAKLAKGISNLTNLTDDDIDIGSTPKGHHPSSRTGSGSTTTTRWSNRRRS